MAVLNIDKSYIDAYMDVIKSDYTRITSMQKVPYDGDTAVFDVKYEVGTVYIRIIVTSYGHDTAHSFIVNKANKFPIGTILKAASWKAPATNFSRGSIFALDAKKPHIFWTGVY